MAKDLGVDAVMVVVNELSTEDKKVDFLKFGMHVFGPNPVSKVKGKKYPGLLLVITKGNCMKGKILY
ncbi:MAG: hypothetical protein C4329_04955 [Chitinophagaceae bacterium]